MLKMLTAEHPVPFSPLSYLNSFCKYLSSYIQKPVMSTIHEFLQQRKEKEIRWTIFPHLTFPRAVLLTAGTHKSGAHKLEDLLQQAFSSPELV